MSGVKGMHKAWRGSGAYANAVRERIKAGGIVKRLQDYIVGKISMEQGQVTAAIALLRKVVPDVAQLELSGEVSVNNVARLPQPEVNSEKWAQQHSPENQPTLQ